MLFYLLVLLNLPLMKVLFKTCFCPCGLILMTKAVHLVLFLLASSVFFFLFGGKIKSKYSICKNPLGLQQFSMGFPAKRIISSCIRLYFSVGEILETNYNGLAFLKLVACISVVNRPTFLFLIAEWTEL